MTIGSMRDRITIQRPVKGVDSYGTPTTVYETVGEVWGAVIAKMGSDRTAAEAREGTIIYEVITRYPDFALRADYRLLWRDKELDILAFADPFGNRKSMKIRAEERR